MTRATSKSETMTETNFNQSEIEERDYLQHITAKVAAELDAVSKQVNSRHTEMLDLKTYLQESKADMDHAEKASVRQSVDMMSSIGEHSVERTRRLFKQLKGGKYEYSDVFPLIYLKMLTDGTSVMSHIKHVVIDEMQDYTPVQYEVIANLYGCKKTILGDHNQSVSPLSSSSAEAIQEILAESECMYMHKSYRSTLQITELAQRIHHNPNLVPIERHGDTPAIVACTRAMHSLCLTHTGELTRFLKTASQPS